jgi:hypothetical protein
LAARWEQFWDDHAVRTGALGAGNPVDELYEMTYTIDYKVWDNLLTRLEYRYDRGNETSDVLDRNGPFDQGTEDDLSTILWSWIYLFG